MNGWLLFPVALLCLYVLFQFLRLIFSLIDQAQSR